MKLLQVLNSYKPSNEKECLFKQSMLDFVSQNPNCFERSETTGHFTASAWLLNNAGDKALLMHHKKLDRWLQLGGHADGDSDLANVALKEAQEESGIQDIVLVSPEIFDLDIHEIPANSKDSQHLHYDVRFLLQVTSDCDGKMNAESKELRWIPKDAKHLPTDNPSILRMFEKWMKLSIN